MKLVETALFTIECDIDDEKAQICANSLAEVFSKYRLEGNKGNDPIDVDMDDIKFTITYKRRLP